MILILLMLLLLFLLLFLLFNDSDFLMFRPLLPLRPALLPALRLSAPPPGRFGEKGLGGLGVRGLGFRSLGFRV